MLKGYPRNGRLLSGVTPTRSVQQLSRRSSVGAWSAIAVYRLSPHLIEPEICPTSWREAHRGRAHGHSRRQGYQGHLPGHHRQPGHVPHAAGGGLRHAGRGRGDAGQGRDQASRSQARQCADLRHGDGRQDEDWRHRHLHLRAAALCGRCDPGSHRRGDAADRVHHRGHPRARHGQGEARARRLQVAPDRPQLPGRADPQRSARSASCRATSSRPARSASSRARAR